jgi:hypothetical protein
MMVGKNLSHHSHVHHHPSIPPSLPSSSHPSIPPLQQSASAPAEPDPPTHEAEPEVLLLSVPIIEESLPTTVSRQCWAVGAAPAPGVVVDQRAHMLPQLLPRPVGEGAQVLDRRLVVQCSTCSPARCLRLLRQRSTRRSTTGSPGSSSTGPTVE